MRGSPGPPDDHGFPPRGWTDLLSQVALWAGFAVLYEIVRWTTGGHRLVAVANARALIRVERRLHVFIEPGLERAVLEGPRVLVHLADWTYWLAQFVVVLAAFVWVYFRRYELYRRFRNAFILANTAGLIVYLTYPLAPPRFFPEYGLVDTLRRYEGLNMHSGVVRGLANQYAAMPSLHAADALLVGLMLFAAMSRSWLRLAFLAWPVWLSFVLLATGNHFGLDVVAGLVLGAAALLVVCLGPTLHGRSGAPLRVGRLPSTRGGVPASPAGGAGSRPR
jgi:membrane-associated phospholipid phosphatase